MTVRRPRYPAASRLPSALDGQAGELLPTRHRKAAGRRAVREVPEGDRRGQGRADRQGLAVRGHRERDGTAEPVAGNRPVRRDRPGPTPVVARVRVPDRDRADRCRRRSAGGRRERSRTSETGESCPRSRAISSPRGKARTETVPSLRPSATLDESGRAAIAETTTPLGQVRPEERLRPGEVAHAGHGLAAELLHVPRSSIGRRGPA